MSIKVEKIKVLLDINLPTLTKIHLSKKLFYFPDETGEFASDSDEPYFTFDVKYSADKLKSIGSHKARVYHFFNNSLFRKILEDQQIAKDDVDRQENAKYNFMFMLGCMFPTYFPVEGNLNGSFESKIERNYFSNNDFMFSDSTFSYIRLTSGAYTVTKALWVNDIINNKNYRQLLDKVIEYNKWEFKKRDELEKKISSIQKKMDESMEIFLKKKKEDAIEQLGEIIKYYADRRGGLLYTKNINGIKTAINSLVSAPKEKRIDYLIYINKSIKSLPSEVRRYISTGELDSLYEQAKVLKTEKEILETLEKPENRKKFEKDKEFLSKIKDYSNLSEVINLVKKYVTPYRVSSNKELQTLIEQFANGESGIKSNNLRDFITYVNSTFLEKKNAAGSVSFSRDLLHSGLMLTNLPFIQKKTGKLENRERRIEATVKLNVFKGVLTQSKIECIHRNAILESTYKHLTENGDSSNGVEIEDQAHLYLDMTGMLNKKKGGRYTIKSIMRGLNKTRKRVNDLTWRFRF